MDADAYAKLRQVFAGKTLAHPAFEVVGHRAHAGGGAQRTQSMILKRVGHAKFGHHCIANEFVNAPAFFLNNVDHAPEIHIEKLDGFVRGELFGDGGEVTDVGEQHGDVHGLSAEIELLSAREQHFHHVVGDVAVEHGTDARFVAFLAREAQAQQHEKSGGQPQLHMRGREQQKLLKRRIADHQRHQGTHQRHRQAYPR